MLLRKGVLKICSKFTGEHPRRKGISIRLLSNFIEITFRHGCSPLNLLHNFRTPFLKNTSGWLLLKIYQSGEWLMNCFFLIKYEWSKQNHECYIGCVCMISKSMFIESSANLFVLFEMKLKSQIQMLHGSSPPKKIFRGGT